MPRLALVSDTHLPRFGRSLPAALMAALRSAAPDLILHLGDHTAAFVADELGTVAPVAAVAGNNDPDDLVARFGTARVLDVAGVRVGLTHGHLGRGRTTPDRADAAFPAGSAEVVAFGHSHRPLVEWRGERLLVNPGSPTDRRREPQPTFAIVDLGEGRGPDARIMPLPIPQPRRARAGSTS